MKVLPNFTIEAKGNISEEFLKRSILSFHQATSYIQNLVYGRNSNKDDLTTVLTDNRGTCSTKHAILNQLAIEHEMNDIKLMLGIFKMNAINTPITASTLSKNHLEYIPEAHTYLKHKDNYFDFTRRNSSPNNFLNDLLFETEIQASEINQGKIQIHKTFLVDWLNKNTDINYSLNDLWEIREQCIRDLSQ
ncbi:hypothetical protein [Sphingobacterium wenxiniae]|uniref:Transglutaminase-like superfamily protein n=1 Tax=Sphingobacterium wenxiniae TaxID=683125 RepID=A0A1I6VMG2_9SPHI|nr:hypothetical protein [Sphingobacterium wenxiniae]SFT14898.1 hypothetical protein SAMN05660206_11554 [Sphingobacterium wenxiniae]